MNPKPYSSNQSSAKMLDIIEFLAEHNNEPMRLKDIAEGLSMSPSTVLRFLSSLMERDYLWQDPNTLQYSLTLKLCTEANKVSANLRLYDLALPIMKQICARFGESVCLAEEQDMEAVYIGVVHTSDQMLQTMQRIGNRAPLHSTGVGKLLLLNYTEPEIDRLIAIKGLPALTANTITTKAGLVERLAQIRRQGYAYDDEECEIGARCIAVPIYNYTGNVVAGLSVTGPISRMTYQKIDEYKDFLVEQGQKLSQLLGYFGGTSLFSARS